MANVLAMLKPLAQPTMNGFDLSSKHVYSSAAGRIDSPVQIECVPKDHFKINVGSFMRTMTLNTAAFLRGKVTFDFYFVPYSQLWHPFNQFVSQRNDAHSANQKSFQYAPVIHLADLFRLAAYMIASPHVLHVPDCHGIPWAVNLFNMLDFFGYGNYLWLRDKMHDGTQADVDAAIDAFEGKYVNVFRAAAYQHVWYDYYRNKYYDNFEFELDQYFSDYVLGFNFDDIPCDTFANSVIPIDYTNPAAAVNQRIYSLFSQRYCQYKQDLLQSMLPSQQFGAVSEVTVDTSNLLTAGPVFATGNNQVAQATSVNGSPVSMNSYLFLNDVDNKVRVDETDEIPIQIRQPHTHKLSSISSAGFDVLALKRAEALQKWRQNALRAGNMVDDNFRAHYGVTPRYEQDNVALKLGSFEGQLNINAVETTAQSSSLTGNNKVGDLGASASCVISGNEIEFNCRDFGVIVCMQYFRPESEYNSTMIDKANRLYDKFDFFTEEYQNLGLDSISVVDYDASLPNVNTVLGFASQYWWYKECLDKVHQEFARSPYYDLGQTTPKVESYKGTLNHWVAPRVLDISFNAQDIPYRDIAALYVSPSILDNVFGVTYYDNGTQGDEYLVYDQLLFNTYFSVKAVRPMSVVGLPNF